MADILWDAQLDGIYECKVTRTGERTGQITIRNIETGDFLLDKQVGLLYGAQFGPDIEDLAHWQEMCIGIVDNK